MLILFLILLLIIAGIILFQLYRLVRWILVKKTRIIRSIWVLSIAIIGIAIYQLFFVNMEFIQSKVYPDLYLVKHPVKDKNKIDNTIKNAVIQHFTTTEKIDSTYTLRFYEYTNNWNPLLIFGDAGTAHFIDHEEDPGGFTTEELSMYLNYKLATFKTVLSNNDNNTLSGVLQYYSEGSPTKTDTLKLNITLNIRK